MRFFNSIQMVGLFAAMPFLISWLDGANFRWAGAAFWAAVAMYFVSGIFITAAVYHWDEFWTRR